MFVNINWSDIAERAIWTFVQGFLASFSVTAISNVEALKSAAIAGAIGGAAAVLSLIKNIVRQYTGTPEE